MLETTNVFCEISSRFPSLSPRMATTKVDVADAIPKNIVQVKAPPDIMTGSRNFQIVMFVVIGAFTLLSMGMLGVIIYHRKNKLMTLAQGGLLGFLVFNSMIAMGSSFMFFPINDWFCRLSGPFCLIPNTFVAAILVGRLWRVYMTLSVANAMGRTSTKKDDNDEKSMSRCPISFAISEHDFMSALGWLALNKCFPPPKDSNTKKSTVGRGRTSFRSTTTLSDTVRLIVMLTLPQIILQIAGAILYPALVDIQLVDGGAGNFGRQYCVREGGRWTYMVGLIWLGLVYCLAVLVAWISRNMPSAFNEKDQIFQAAGCNCIVSLVVISLIFSTDLPRTSPNLSVGFCVSF
jgi:hypothetical protein